MTRAPVAEDILVLDHAARDDEVRGLIGTSADVERLWEVCQIPDYRKIAPATHAEARRHALQLSQARRQNSDRLVRQAGSAGGSDRRRYRHALEPHRPYQDLDLRGEPAGLARRSGTLAGRHPRRRGQTFRRPARTADRAFRRSPHQRADAAAARECGTRAGDEQDRRSRRRRSHHRPSRRLRLRARIRHRADRRPRRCRTRRKRPSSARSPPAPRV